MNDAEIQFITVCLLLAVYLGFREFVHRKKNKRTR